MDLCRLFIYRWPGPKGKPEGVSFIRTFSCPLEMWMHMLQMQDVWTVKRVA